MRSKLSRHLVLGTLAAALLIAPLPASAAPWGFETFGSLFGSSWGSLTGWAGNVLHHLWAEEGGSFDPLGRSTPNPLRLPEDNRQ